MPLSTASIADGPGKFHGAEQTNRRRRAFFNQITSALFVVGRVRRHFGSKSKAFYSGKITKARADAGCSRVDLTSGPDNQLMQRPKM
jgi:hypothetical protein